MRKKKFDKICAYKNINTENVVRLWNQSKKTENPSFHFKKMETSIIDSNQINFEILDNKFLIKILEIKFHIRTFNEEVKSVNEYLKMTFDSSMTSANHQIVKKEIQNKNYLISNKAIYIVKKINQILN